MEGEEAVRGGFSCASIGLLSVTLCPQFSTSRGHGLSAVLTHPNAGVQLLPWREGEAVTIFICDSSSQKPPV